MSKKKSVMANDPLAWDDEEPVEGDILKQGDEDTSVQKNIEASADTEYEQENETQPLEEESIVDNEDDSTSPFELSGKISIAEVEALHQQLTKRASSKVAFEIDASGIENIDSAGLQLLAAFSISASEQGTEVSWQSPPENILKSAQLLDLKETIGF